MKRMKARRIKKSKMIRLLILKYLRVQVKKKCHNVHMNQQLKVSKTKTTVKWELNYKKSKKKKRREFRGKKKKS